MIWEFKNNALYHYCTFETAINFILPNRQLRLGLLKNTNDPRENKDLIFGSFTTNPSESFSPGEVLEMNKIVSQVIREDCKVLCFSYSDVLEGYQLSQMWAHYGGGHRGVCIGIDYGKFFKENPKFIKGNFFGRVAYVSPAALAEVNITRRYRSVNMSIFNDTVARNNYLKNSFRIQNADYLFFTKSIEWEHEQEARLIHFSSEINDEYCSIKESLTHVFLGMDFNRDNYQKILTAVADKNCSVYPLDYSGEWLYCLSKII